MKRLLILLFTAAAGAAFSVLYALFPPEEAAVTAREGEDGNIELTAAPKEDVPEISAVAFSYPAGFYDRNISVELDADKGAEIYCTIDGSDPVISESCRYDGAIEINAGTEVKAVTIKAVTLKDGAQSKIYTRSFVVGTDVFNRFDDETLVFVLSTDPYNLYDYDYGIAVPGRIYDEYVKEHPGEEIPYNAPGNYYLSGREAERDIYVEVFESGGNNVISQAAGVRLAGGYSRVVDQKSFKLIARKEYDPENGKFKYPFFSDAVSETGAPIYEYDRIVLRNGANDREFAGVRDELSQRLAGEYGFPCVQHTAPCAVFLNGEYYGFAWLHENYNEDYLATQFGGLKENYEIVANTEYPEEGNERGLNDYAKVTEYFDKDLTDDKIFNEFCGLVDIDNLIQYCCLQVFISNKDWPGNNYKAFRYYPDGSENPDNEFLDGRWRYLFFDAEFAWGLYGEGYKASTLSDLLDGTHSSGESKALSALLKREDMREKFADTMCDLISAVFTYENITETLDELCKISDKEQFYALDLGITSEWAHRGTFEDSRNQIREFAEHRNSYVLSCMTNEFGMEPDFYDVSVSGTEGAAAYLNTQMTENGTVFASYYTGFGVEIKADVYEGYKFLKWEINGRDYLDPNIKITSSMAENGAVHAKLFVTKEALHNEPLYIKEISTEKGAGYITLYNPNEEAVYTKDLYLSDNVENICRWAIPNEKIEPYGELKIVMKNNKDYDSLLKLQANFSLKRGETLVLSDGEKVLRSVFIPLIPEGKIYCRTLSSNYKVSSASNF